MKQEKQVMIKYEYCCVLGGSDNMSKVAARANDGWRVVSVDGHQGYAYFYMEREVRAEPLYAKIKIDCDDKGNLTAHVMKFNVGDVVMLKSGGPKMTVSAVEGGRYRCTWFGDDMEVHCVGFTDTSLTATT